MSTHAVPRPKSSGRAVTRFFKRMPLIRSFGRPRSEQSTIPRYLNEVSAELKKVAWPTRHEVFRNSWIVLVVVSIMMALIGGVDAFFTVLSERIYN